MLNLLVGDDFASPFVVLLVAVVVSVPGLLLSAALSLSVSLFLWSPRHIHHDSYDCSLAGIGLHQVSRTASNRGS